MAIRYFTGTTGGLWTTASNWNNYLTLGVPGIGSNAGLSDDVYSNGRIVVINTNINLGSTGSLKNSSNSTPPITINGFFSITGSGTFNITANTVNTQETSPGSANAAILTTTGLTNGSIVNLYGGVTGGTNVIAYGFYNNSGITLNFYGNNIAGSAPLNGSNGAGIYNLGTMNVPGTVNTYLGNGTTGHAIYSNSIDSIVNINNLIIFQSGAGSASYHVYNSGTTIINNQTCNTLSLNGGVVANYNLFTGYSMVFSGGNSTVNTPQFLNYGAAYITGTTKVDNASANSGIDNYGTLYYSGDCFGVSNSSAIYNRPTGVIANFIGSLTGNNSATLTTIRDSSTQPTGAIMYLNSTTRHICYYKDGGGVSYIYCDNLVTKGVSSAAAYNPVFKNAGSGSLIISGTSFSGGTQTGDNRVNAPDYNMLVHNTGSGNVTVYGDIFLQDVGCQIDATLYSGGFIYNNSSSSSSYINIFGSLYAGSSGMSICVMNRNLGTINISGNTISGGSYNGLAYLGGTTSGPIPVVNYGTGFINITANTIGSGVGNFGPALHNNVGGVINVTANTFNVGSGSNSHLVYNNGVGIINVNSPIVENNTRTIGSTNLAGGSFLYNAGGTTGTINFVGGNLLSVYGSNSTIWNNSTGTINITGTSIIGGFGNTATIHNQGTGIINISGVTLISGGSGTTASYLVNNVSTGSINITGSSSIDLYGAIGTTNHTIYNQGTTTGIINISSANTVTSSASTGVAHIVFNSTTGSINITGGTYYMNTGGGYGITSGALGTVNIINGETFYMTNSGAGDGIRAGTTCNLNTYFNRTERLSGGTGTGSMIYHRNNAIINFKGTNIESGYGTNAYGMYCSGLDSGATGGTINITATTLVINSGSTAHGVYVAGGANTINIIDNINLVTKRVGVTTGTYIKNEGGLSVVRCIGTDFRGGSGINAYGIQNGTTTGSIYVTGTTFGSGSGTNSYGIYNSANNTTGIIDVTGQTFIVGDGLLADGIRADLGARINAFFNESYRVTASTSTGNMIYGNNTCTINFKGTKIESGYGTNSYGVTNGISSSGALGVTINISADTLVINSGTSAHGIYITNAVYANNVNMVPINTPQTIRNNNQDSHILFNNGPSIAFINYYGGDLTSGNLASSHAINNGGAGTISVTGNSLSVGRGTTTYGLYNQSTGRINATIGNVNPSNGYANHTIFNAAAGRIDISATTISASSLLNTYTINSTTNGTLNITADTISSSNSTPAINSQGASSINNVVFGNLIFNNGVSPVYFIPYSSSRLVSNTSNDSYIIMEDTNNTYETFASTGFTGLNSLMLPVSGNVRSNKTYGYSGSSPSYTITGSSIVPPASAVAYGTLFDNTTGTSVISIYDFGNSLTTSGQTV
jgi:hypothetical protein